ncbi:hypothetical protein P7C70_g6396, partial [Phenoliferia sp. Uapishka_3]
MQIVQFLVGGRSFFLDLVKSPANIGLSGSLAVAYVTLQLPNLDQKLLKGTLQSQPKLGYLSLVSVSRVGAHCTAGQDARAATSFTEKRSLYDQALREANTPRITYPSSAIATRRPHSPNGTRLATRPASPAGYRPPSPRMVPPPTDRDFGPRRPWSDPHVDPHQLFQHIFKLGASQPSMRSMHEDPYKDPSYMRPYEVNTMDDMLGGILPPHDPFRRGMPSDSRPRDAAMPGFDGQEKAGGYGATRGDRPWEAISKDPWGRRFEGEILPGREGRPRQMKATLTEGEKHRNGDFQVRKSEHHVEEGSDGIIRFSTHTVEMRQYSGQARVSRSPSHDRYGDQTRRQSSAQNQGRRSASHDRYQRPHYAEPLEYQPYLAIEPNYTSRNLPALPAPRRPLAIEASSSRHAPRAITAGGYDSQKIIAPGYGSSTALVPTGGEMGLRRSASSRRL